MFIESRDESREFFLRVWRKLAAGEALEPLESVIADVIRAHPEYHRTLDAGERALEHDYDGSGGRTNPFLHMGLHIALAEQLQSDRPPGIREIYRRLRSRDGHDAHAAEHRMMDCLAAELWHADREQRAPDVEAYLRRARRLLR